MNKAAVKKNISSMQVLKTLKTLLQGDYTMGELVAKLNEDETERHFNNSVVSKYINTCRFCGINIIQVHNRYFVTRVPFGLELTNNEIDLLQNLNNIIKQTMSKKSNKIFDKFLDKLNRFSNKKIVKIEKNTYKLSAEIFEEAVLEHRKISFILKNNEIVDCIPIDTLEKKNKLFFHILRGDEDKLIDSSMVSGIKILGEKFIPSPNEVVVVYKLTGALAKRYSLREHERMVKPFDGNCIVVSNQGEAKDVLLARLLRYDVNCEILNPRDYRETMKNIIDSMLSNYGG